jgi:ATP-dependent phosphofructokinase / diphosphate-dependent phosphofructokinase
MTADKPMKIGLLTGGGDAPGLNAVIRAVVIKANALGHKTYGFNRGWRGMLDKDYIDLTLKDVSDIHMLGGTILGSSRTNVAKIEGGFDLVKKNMKDLGLGALVAIGGEDTLGVANQLYEAGGAVVGVPKTIDNDVSCTDYTFGFDTAINRSMEAMDRLHTTAKSHHRVMVVEIMGRHAGWMALHAGLASAHFTLIPEVPYDMDELCAQIKKRHSDGSVYTIIAVSEGFENDKLASSVMHSAQKDDFGHVQLGTGIGVGQALAEEIEDQTEIESRHVVLGHLQRGGAPTAFDRVLGTRLGVKVVELIDEGKYGFMSAIKSSEIIAVPLADAVGKLKTVPPERYEIAKLFFGL